MLCAELNCAPADFDSHALTITGRSPDARDSSVALVVTCGTGTVFSVVPELMAWVREHAPEPHFRVLQPFFLAEVAARAIDAGFAGASARGLTLGLVLAEEPTTPPVPPPFEMRELSSHEIEQLRETKEFDNALATPDEVVRVENFRTAYALLDGSERPVAITGMWAEGDGVDEIGVDVRRDVRGKGLASTVVLRATRDVLERGRVPVYTCGVTNIRSLNNGIRCGYRPFWTVGRVWAPPASDPRP
jgi:hypothetical protein